MSYERLRSAYERLQRAYERQGKAYEQGLAENAELRRRLEETERRLAEAQAEIAELRRQLLGPKAERLTAEQQEQLKELAEDLKEHAQRPPPVAAEVLVEEKPQAQERRRRRHPLPVELETETVRLEPEIGPCPGCGSRLQVIGEEVSEEIDLIPARIIRRRLVRPKYACRCGEAGVTIAPLPPRLIPQSRLGLGLAVYLLLARFDDHLSFYNLERQLRERHGVIIPRQQMVQWVEQIASWLRPLYEALGQAMLAGDYLQVDETSVRVLDPEVKGKAARGYLWFFAVPGGDVCLVFDRRRSLQPVRSQFQDFAGTLQTDAYEVYRALERQHSRLKRIGCLAHARRKFYRALQENWSQALWFIAQIRRLYQIEDPIRELSPQERYAARQAQAPPIWQELRTRAERLEPTQLPKSSLGKAIRYFLKEYDALTGYLEDGRFEIDNNLLENAIRPTAVGRKRWLFIGHPDAGWRSAVIYSLLISCRRRGINPQDYLSDVLGRLPSLKHRQIQSLLPGNWTPPGLNDSS